MGKDHHDLPDRAFERGKQYEMRNGGCPQCTLAAIFDVLGLEDDSVFKAATAFADGVGLTGDGHCGALSGGTIAIGYLHGRDRKDFGDMMGLVKANLMAKQLRDRFVDEYGTVRCRDLQKRLFGRFYNLYDPEELQAALAAGMLDTCSNVVGDVARITVDILLADREARLLKSSLLKLQEHLLPDSHSKRLLRKKPGSTGSISDCGSMPVSRPCTKKVAMPAPRHCTILSIPQTEGQFEIPSS